MTTPLPYKHQLEAARLLAEHDQFALLAEMGAGKSRMIALDFEYKIQHQGLQNLLIVAPSGAYRNWEGELNRWVSPDIMKTVRLLTWISGKTKPKDLADFIKIADGRPKVLLMNVEALSRVVAAREGVEKFLASAPTMWVIDESQSIKAPGSQRTKFILSVASQAKWRRILTGMVAPENPLNVYSQFQFLDSDILGFRSFFAFRARYSITKKVDFKNGRRPVEIVVGYRNLEELQRSIAKRSFRVRTSDVVDLPPRIYMPMRHVDLTPEQDRAYKEMKKLAMTEINGQFVTAQIAATVLSKLHSILCGHVTDENGNVHDLPSYRVDSLLELLDDHSGKAIIWAPYPRFLEKIAKALEEEYGPESTVRFWGATSNEDRQTGKVRFQEDPKCRWFVSNQSVGGEGNTLTAATLVVYAANSWKNSERQQSEARAHRIGQTQPVTYVDLGCAGSMEERLVQALRNKADLAALISGDRIREWIV